MHFDILRNEKNGIYVTHGQKHTSQYDTIE